MPRGRPPKLEPSKPLNVHLSGNLRDALDAVLYSELEQRIPHGAYQRFFERLLSWAFATEEMDLAPYVSCLPGEHIVRGKPETLARLRALMEKS